MTSQKHTTNPTGIVTLPKSEVAIGWVRNPETRIVEKFTLERLELKLLAALPKKSRIVVIAKAKYSEMSFDAGTLGEFKPLKDVLLSDIDKGSPLHLRVIVFDPVNKKILASCENLWVYEAEEGGRKPLLPVEPTELYEQLWKLHVQGDERPVLQVNCDPALEMLEKIKSDPFCQALVLPAAIKGTLEHLLRNRGDDADGSDSWQDNWVQFLSNLHIDLPEDSEDSEEKLDPEKYREWVDNAVTRITTSLKLKTKFAQTLGDAKQ